MQTDWRRRLTLAFCRRSPPIRASLQQQLRLGEGFSDSSTAARCEGRNRRRVTDLRGTVRNREVAEGVCCRTPPNLVTSAYHLVTLSLGSGIEKEKLFQIQSLKRIYLGYLKKGRKKGVPWRNIGSDHLRTHALRLQPGVKTVQRGEFKQVWLHPQEMWCLYGWGVITSQQPSDSTLHYP